MSIGHASQSVLRSTLIWLAMASTALGGPEATEQALEAATRLVVAQCRRASLGADTYWTSQPGALRAFRRDTGALVSLYKLYSSPELAVTDPARLAGDRPSDWLADPDRWVDLNAPTSTGGEFVYPIADPRADAEGFSFQPATTGLNPLPMPVVWMYLLQDGTLGTLDADHRFTPLANPTTGRPSLASSSNPMIARVAWWADDATCKINLNTASEGVFWDTPRCDTTEERYYGRFQPARGEWQRDMGHPAAVCLSSVLFPGQRLHLPGTTSALDPLPLEIARQLWKSAPGVPDAGSLGGTVAVTPDRSGAVEESIASLFDTPSHYTATADLPQPARARAARGGFFLTTHSRAPDYTRDGRPRISLWPLKSPDWQVAVTDPSRVPGSSLTEFDALMARVSCLSSDRSRTIRPMAVVRSESTHQFSEVFALEEGHNGKLHGMLLNDASRRRLGPRSFGQKYGSGPYDDLSALVAASLSYVRDVNVNDPWSTNPFPRLSGSTPGAGQVTPLSFNPSPNANVWGLSSSPTPRGLGRFPTVSEVALLVSLRHRTRAGELPRGFYGDNQSAAATLGPEYDHFEIEVGLLIEGFVPAQGGSLSPEVSFVLGGYGEKGLTQQTSGQGFDIGRMSLNGRALVFPDGVFSGRGASRSTASTPAPDAPPAARWHGTAGSLGIRFLRDIITFKPILFSQSPGSPPPQLEFSGSPTGSAENHLRLLVHSSGSVPPANEWGLSDLVQSIPLAFPEIRGGPRLPFFDPVPVPLREGAGHRMERARTSGLVLGANGIIHADDVVQSLIPNHGDFRLVAAKALVRQRSIPDGWNTDAARWPTFVAHPNYGKTTQAHALTDPNPLVNSQLRVSTPYAGTGDPGEVDAGYFEARSPAPPAEPNTMIPPTVAVRPDFPLKPWRTSPLALVGPLSNTSNSFPALTGGEAMERPASEVFQITRHDRLPGADGPVAYRRGLAWPDLTGDFDNGIARSPDGPFINAAEPGEARAWATGGTPYFDNLNAPWRPNPGTSSPYRQVPSSMMLGSLPTGIQSNVPWQTLLFRPDPNRGTPNAHFGSTQTPDHSFADFFRMPVVKPSTVVDWNHPDAAWMPSDAISTEGRINMNCELVPFTHIQRTTALHAAFKAQKILAIPDEAGGIYKTGAGLRPWRHHIDPRETLRQWVDRFATGDVFRTATEIAEQWLVPEGVTLEAMPSFWARHRFTGDNSKERPYANLYPHLTTRSLTYDLHIVVEEINKAPGTPPNRFVPATDSVHSRSQRTLKITGRMDALRTSIPDYVGRSGDENQDPLDSSLHWSSPDVAAARNIEPEWQEIGIDDQGAPRISWRAAPDQACLLETSTDLREWSVVDTFRTGIARQMDAGHSSPTDDPRLAVVHLPHSFNRTSLHVRLRWHPN